ncbi:hypothetical protein QIG52_27340, partial [Klebsiella pneumoniae]|nr:hypothetical protein [Klebsiella pneumoniae]MDH8297568.1 hypothetical protein [Klebsiella pneumoniae]
LERLTYACLFSLFKLTARIANNHYTDNNPSSRRQTESLISIQYLVPPVAGSFVVAVIRCVWMVPAY